ncbi:hypothetical protein PS3A_40000 [Pseudomonas sp. 3A(2025)]
MELSEQIGARLREQRTQAGLTQDQLAEKLGVSKRTQGNYESGASDAPASYLTMAMGLGFDVMYILSGVRTTMANSTLTDAEDSMVKQYRIIPDDDQRSIRRFLKAMVDDANSNS